MTPEQIAAIFTGVVTVMGSLFGYLQARMNRRTSELEGRVAHLEAELAKSKNLFREAVKFIRILLAHITELTVAHQLGAALPPVPEVPELLKEEV